MTTSTDFKDKVLFVTPRQREIAFLKCQGLTATEIANRLVISSRTVEYHLSSVYQYLGVAGYTELAICLHRNPEILRVQKSKRTRRKAIKMSTALKVSV